MSTMEIVVGDFEPGVVRFERTLAGRRYIEVARSDGTIEQVTLRSQIAGCAEHNEGTIGRYLSVWMRRCGLSLSDALYETFRHERLFVVVLVDGRKFVARATPDVMADLKSCARPAPRRPDLARIDLSPEPARPVPSPAGGFFARWWVGSA
jgi:hypothetical protein